MDLGPDPGAVGAGPVQGEVGADVVGEEGAFGGAEGESGGGEEVAGWG